MEERNYKLYVHISPSGKRYYGITSRKVEKRWGNNGRCYKSNEHFYNAINKYGWENFHHLVLFDNLTREQAGLLEQCYIALYNTTNSKYGYNQSYGGQNGLHSEQTKKKIGKGNKGKLKGIPLTEQHREKISAAQKGEKHWNYGKHTSDEAKRKMSKTLKGKNKGKNSPVAKPIIMLTKDGEFIRRFVCIQQAIQYLGKNSGGADISRCAKGINKTAYGYIWKYEKDYIKEQEQAI